MRAGRPGDRHGRDDRAVDRAHRRADGGEAELQLVERCGPTTAAHLDEGVVELGPVDRRVRGTALQVARWQREYTISARAPCPAPCSAAGRRPRPSSSRRSTYWLSSCVDLSPPGCRAAPQVHRLAGSPRQPLHGRPGQLGEVVQALGRAACRENNAPGRKRPPGRGAPTGCAPTPAAAGTSSTWPGRARRPARRTCAGPDSTMTPSSAFARSTAWLPVCCGAAIGVPSRQSSSVWNPCSVRWR